METFVMWNKKKKSKIEEEYPFMFKTNQGWKIIQHGMDDHGMLIIIAKRKRTDGYDYPVGKQYSARTGTWAYGSYPKTLKEAKEIFNDVARYPEFDPYDERDMEFMRGGRFNFNHTGSTYLETNDYRDPEFDPYKAYTESMGDGTPTREEWLRIRERHIASNPSLKRGQTRR